jgi:NAD(P)H-quinone oxidoreductase subunit 4
MTITPGIVNSAFWGATQLARVIAAASAAPVATAPPVALPSGNPAPPVPTAAAPTTTGGTTTTTAAVELPALLYSALIWGVIVLAIIVLFMPDRTKDQRGRIRVMGLAGTGLALFLSLWAVQTQANNAVFTASGPLGGQPGGELSENHAWIVSTVMKAGYHLDADGLALGVMLMTALVFFCAALAGLRNDRRVRLFTVSLLLLETGVNGILVSNDWLLFLMFWALPILPIALLVRGWGGEGASRAATRGVVTGVLSTALVAAGALILVFQSGAHSFDIVRDAATLPGPAATASFWLLTSGFLLAAGTVPLHLPLLDLQGRGGGIVAAVLVAVMPATALYALMRVTVAALPGELAHFSLALAALGVITAVWGAVAALRGRRLRRIVGYIGLAQVGPVLVAISVSTGVALVGADLLLISRGLVVAALMLVATGVEERTRGLDVDQIGGLAWQAPRLAAVWILGGLTAAGAPLLSGFAAVLLIFTGSYTGHRISTVLAIGAVVLTAFAILRVAQRVFFGGEREAFSRVRDLGTLELTYYGLLIGLIVIFGIFPNRFLGLISNGASALITHAGS